MAGSACKIINGVEKPGVKPVDPLKLEFGCGPHKRVGFQGVDATPFVGVDYVVAASPSTGEIVGCATPTEYVQGVNFTVSGGLLDWTIGGVNVPPVGARCSIRYYARPRYIVTVDPYTHRQLGFVEFRPARQEVQLFWRGQAVLESLGTAP